MLIYTSMKKRILTITVAVLAALLCAFAFTACGEEEGAPESDPYPYYTLTKVGSGLTLDVTLMSQLPAGALTLPASSYYYADTADSKVTKHDSPLPVTAIAPGAFKHAGRLTSVVIGSTYESLGESCFEGCGSLTSVQLSEKVTAIPASAFKYCSELKSVTGGATVASVGDEAFLSCSKLNTLELNWADNFTVGDSAFFYAISLRSIDLTKASRVASHAFQGWQSSQTITEPRDKSGFAADWNN